MIVTVVSEKTLTPAPPDGGTIELSPYDHLSRGRSTPMLWFYEHSLEPSELVKALETVLSNHYALLCGRYSSPQPPTAIQLNNAGVPVRICTVDAPLSEAIAHVHQGDEAAPRVFERNAHDSLVPPKAGMDPDRGSSEEPLLSVQITTFASGGTAIGLLLQHGVGDADAEIGFVRSWARAYRGLEIDPAPTHDRCVVNTLSTEGSGFTGDKPGGNFKIKVVPPGETNVPEFVGVLPKLGGSQCVVVPFGKTALKRIKEAASAGLSDGKFVSTDDVLVARVWRALVAVRCSQLSLSVESDEISTCSRACNFRRRTEPPLGDGYFANGVTQVWTEASVRELLCSSVQEVALRLRADLQAFTPPMVAARARWCVQTTAGGCSLAPIFDEHALTFIISSWMFDWEGADFEGRPIAFDHTARTRPSSPSSCRAPAATASTCTPRARRSRSRGLPSSCVRMVETMFLGPGLIERFTSMGGGHVTFSLNHPSA